MNARFVYTKIWSDDWFASLSQPSKLLFLYLLTNVNAGLSGIYELSDRKMLFETGLSEIQIAKGKKELTGKIVFYKGWIKIVNSSKYNKSFTESIKNKTALEKELSYISSEVLGYFDSLSKKTDSLSSKPDSTNTNTNINTNTNKDSLSKKTEDIKKEIRGKIKAF